MSTIKNYSKNELYIKERKMEVPKEGDAKEINWKRPDGKMIAIYILFGLIVIFFAVILISGNSANKTNGSASARPTVITRDTAVVTESQEILDLG